MGGETIVVRGREVSMVGRRFRPGEKLESGEKPPAYGRAECFVAKMNARSGGAKKRSVNLGLELIENAHWSAVFREDNLDLGGPAVGVMNERGELTIVVFRNLDVPRREGCSFG